MVKEMQVKFCKRKGMAAAKKSKCDWQPVHGDITKNRLAFQYERWMHNGKPHSKSFFLTFDVATSFKYEPLGLFELQSRTGMHLQRAWASVFILNDPVKCLKSFNVYLFSVLAVLGSSSTITS